MNPETLSPFSLESQIALVTGGASGIGFGIASAMIDAGATVMITGRNEERLKQAVIKLGARATYMVHDVTNRNESKAVIQRVENEVGPITILVNNAGNHLKKSALKTSDQEFDLVMTTHVNSAFSLSRAAAEQMIERQNGSILFIASMASFLAIPLVPAYSTAKTALLGMVRSLCSEWSPHGIRVNAIAPGFIESDMLYGAIDSDEERKKKILGRSLLGRFGKADEIGHAAVYLCSPAGSFITGICLPVDGGVHVAF